MACGFKGFSRKKGFHFSKRALCADTAHIKWLNKKPGSLYWLDIQLMKIQKVLTDQTVYTGLKPFEVTVFSIYHC